MKRIMNINAIACAIAVFCSGLFAAQAAQLPKLKIDNQSINRNAPPITSFAPVAKKAAPSVVNIYTTKTIKFREIDPFFADPFLRRFFGLPDDLNRIPREQKEQSLGSGVIVSEDGYILTNNHVVEGADEIKVALADGKTIYDAKVVGTDPKTDIAVIKVEASNLPAITIGDSDKIEVGDIVLAIGNPFGVGQTVTWGIVSAKSRAGMGIVDYEDFIQTDASINPGNSGGALVDIEGRLIGINTAILSRTGGNQGIGFAVPVNLARYVMEQIISSGKVKRGYLGIYIQPVTPELAKEFKLEDAKGALVGEVTPKSPAEAAGLKEGDVIIEYNGKKVEDSRHLRLMVAQTPPGTKVTMKVIRDGKEKTITATLDELPSEGLAKAGRSGGGLRKGEVTDPLDGVEVADIDRRAREQYDIPDYVKGALVVNVEPNSPAAAAGLRPGDVITEINRKPVRNADEAIEVSKEIKSSRVLLRVWSGGGSHYIVVDASRRR